jgi:hypothetical protein
LAIEALEAPGKPRLSVSLCVLGPIHFNLLAIAFGDALTVHGHFAFFVFPARKKVLP